MMMKPHDQREMNVKLEERIVFAYTSKSGGDVLRVRRTRAETNKTKKKKKKHSWLGSGIFGTESREKPKEKPKEKPRKKIPDPPPLNAAMSSLFVHSPRLSESDTEEGLEKSQPYSWWSKVLKYPRASGVPANSPRAVKGNRLIGAVERVLEKVVHNAYLRLYVPPAVPDDDDRDFAPFELVSEEELKLICLTAKALILKDPTVRARRSTTFAPFDSHTQTP